MYRSVIRQSVPPRAQDCSPSSFISVDYVVSALSRRSRGTTFATAGEKVTNCGASPSTAILEGFFFRVGPRSRNLHSRNEPNQLFKRSPALARG